MKVIKRDGSEAQFRAEKIANAIRGANGDVAVVDRMPDNLIEIIAERVTDQCEHLGHEPKVEEIQDMVEDQIFSEGKEYFALGKAYVQYRLRRKLARVANTTDERIMTILDCTNEEMNRENSNKNPSINSVQRDYMAGEVSRDLTHRILLPKEVVQAHEDGLIHFHDEDYFAQRMHNCDLINLNDMLQNGTVISGTYIDTPHSFSTACNIATQIIAQVASNQYGGQSITLSHLAPFVDVSRKKIEKEVLEEEKENGLSYSVEQRKNIVHSRLKKEIEKGVQTIQYQLITLMTTNGQAPFLSVFMYINEVPEGQLRDDLAMVIEEVLKQRYKGVQNQVGAWITPAFPKLLYVLDENNAYEGSEYFYLTQMAAKCTARRMVPDYISAKVMKELKLSKGETPGNGDVYPCMGCRSFLTPDRSGNGYRNVARALDWKPEPKYYGRFNQGVVTLNLPYVALASEGNVDKFWELMNEALEICHTALRCRHERLKGTLSDAAPILWQHGALARLDPGDVIDPLLYDGYSTISLGYAGLYECVKYMTGVSHTEPEVGRPFGLSVMQALNDACLRWKAAENIDYSVYGTPIESTTYKFAKALQNHFGIIEGITDHEYITNSYHVNVREKIDAFTKLSFEADFQELSPGGAISYVEVPDMQDNLEAVIEVIQHIYENIMYAELNTKSDYCQVCGFDGEITTHLDEDGNVIWECPNCGNHNKKKLNVARRTCGYIGSNWWSRGRSKEIVDRCLHL